MNPIDDELGLIEKEFFIMKKISAIILSVLLCLFLFNQLDQQQNHAFAQKNQTLELAQEQWRQLWKVGAQLTEGPVHVTVKWQGAWASPLSSQEAAAILANSLGFTAPTAAEFQGHQQYVAVLATKDVKSTFTLTKQEHGENYVMVRVEAFNREGLDKLQMLQVNYGTVLNEAGVGIQWNGAIQGELSSSAKPTKLILARLESFMKMQWKEVAGVDEYQDGNTVSLSYHVGDLPLTVLSGEQRINIQLALHQSSDSDKQEVSIGSPLLTVEY